MHQHVEAGDMVTSDGDMYGWREGRAPRSNLKFESFGREAPGW
jgi:hypothetical protein